MVHFGFSLSLCYHYETLVAPPAFLQHTKTRDVCLSSLRKGQANTNLGTHQSSLTNSGVNRHNLSTRFVQPTVIFGDWITLKTFNGLANSGRQSALSWLFSPHWHMPMCKIGRLTISSIQSPAEPSSSRLATCCNEACLKETNYEAIRIGLPCQPAMKMELPSENGTLSLINNCHGLLTLSIISIPHSESPTAAERSFEPSVLQLADYTRDVPSNVKQVFCRLLSRCSRRIWITWNSMRSGSYAIVEHPYFEGYIIFMILLSSATLVSLRIPFSKIANRLFCQKGQLSCTICNILVCNHNSLVVQYVRTF
ncbi:unnamed protein product [Protopolystoma xenopodis]|uniref:Uncharacterized protein n=1 Tax=Protopolystoma xenopodis TaxID=117903 RepID=A0A3S5ATQ2_9PLAT|nr:unnamed protein product [Protopolystoma xenopodis]